MVEAGFIRMGDEPKTGKFRLCVVVERICGEIVLWFRA